MLSREFLTQKHAQAAGYERYVATGTAEQQRRWKLVYEAAHLAQHQQSLIQSFTRQVHVLVVSGIWCGDCIQQVPLLQRIAEANPQSIDLRILDRDSHRDLIEPIRVNGGDRIPAVIFMAEDYEFCSLSGDRTLARYRAMAKRQLGVACLTGLVPPAQDEIDLTLQDWLNEFERVHLMLRLSPRLRQKHAD